MINTTDFETKLNIETQHWSISDYDRLSTMLALLLMGHHHSVDRILHMDATEMPKISSERFDLVIEELTKYPPDHRDGLLFQLIAWIQTTLQGDLVVRPPDLSPTRQGFDGFSIRLSEGRKFVHSVTISEEKVTNDVRERFLTEVRKLFLDVEQGKRNPEIIAVGTMLLKGVSTLDPSQISGEPDWYKRKKYRAAFALRPYVNVETGQVSEVVKLKTKDDLDGFEKIGDTTDKSCRIGAYLLGLDKDSLETLRQLILQKLVTLKQEALEENV